MFICMCTRVREASRESSITMYTFIAILIFAFTSTVSSNQIICRELPDGFYPDTSSGCVNFYRCVNGMTFRFTCAPGTKWSERLNTCDHAYNVKCEVATAPSHSHRDYEPRTRDFDPHGAESEDHYRRPYSSSGGHHSHGGSESHQHQSPTTQSTWESTFSTTAPRVRRPSYAPPVTDRPVYWSEERSRELSPQETTDTDADASYWSQFSTTRPVIQLATGQVNTEIITSDVSTVPTLTSTTTETTTTRRNLFTLRKRKDPVPTTTTPMTSTVATSTAKTDATTSAQATGEETTEDMRNENWAVNGVPKVNDTVDGTVDGTVGVGASANDTEEKSGRGETTVTPIEEDKSINRRVRMQSGSNSLIGTMMKWASKNIVQSSSSTPRPPSSSSSEMVSNDSGVRETGEHGNILMQSPFDLTVELSSVKPLETPITEGTDQLTSAQEQREQSSMRPVYFPPSVTAHSFSRGSRYVAQSVPPIHVNERVNDETIDHPSPWSFPIAHGTGQDTSSALNSRERRDKYLARNIHNLLSQATNSGVSASRASAHADPRVGLISQGQCICSKP